jgi:hypothetical protein
MFRTWLQIALLIVIFTLHPTRPALGTDAVKSPAPVDADELVFGNGTPGPFALSWTQVQFGSERLSVNGTALMPGLDYRLEYETGALTFAQPLQWGQVAQVEYRYDSARAKPNHGPVPIPLLMRVWGSSSGRLQLVGAVQPTLVPGGTPSGSLVGFRGETALGGSRFSSLFLLAPEANGRLPANRWQRAALQFGASRTTGPFQFRATLGQAGTRFDPANDYQLQQGLRTLDLSAAFDPSKGVSFTSQVKRQDARDASQKGEEQASIANQLTLAPASGTKLTLSQESARKGRSQGPAETLDALRGQFEQKLGSGTVATLLAERRHTDTNGTTTAGIDLASHLTDQTRLTAGFVQSENDRQGRDSTARMGLDTHAAQLGFHIGFNQHLSQKQGDTCGTEWGVTAGRHGLLAVDGTSMQRIAAGGQSQQEQQLRVEASPLRGVKIGELSATQHVGADAARETRETSLELSPLRELRVAGALRDEEMADGVAHIRSVSGAVKPAPFLDLSGAYKTRDLPAGDDIVTRNLQLALVPARGFKLQGSYAENPEEKDGHVLPTTDTSLGLESAIGSLAFGGSYTLGQGTDPTNADGSGGPRQRQQSEFRLALNMWGHSRLYSRYTESQERAGSITLNRTLSLGFTRSLSDHFYLLLEGEVTEVQVNGVPQPGMSDQRAQAKLALRF